MNKKLIALAVSSAIAAPMLAQAEDSGPNLYGRVNLALAVNDSGDDTTTDLYDVVSRFGIRGEEDLGNGLAAIYQYEFRVNADIGSIRADARAQRLSYVGLKGGFGEVKAGTIWGTHFNFTGTHLDPSYSLGYFGYTGYARGDYRIESAINYTGNFGPVSVGVDLQVDGSNAADDNVDRYVVGVKYNGPVTAAVVYDKQKTSRVDGVAITGAFVDADGAITDVTDVEPIVVEGDNDIDVIEGILAYSGDGYNVNVGAQQAEDDSGALDRTTYFINAGFNVGDSNRVLLGYWNGEGDGDDTSEGDGILAGFYHSLSSRTKLYFEGHTGEINDADADLYLFGIRHDF